jgi:hypothetical protein
MSKIIMSHNDRRISLFPYVLRCYLEYADGFKIELIPCYEDLIGTRPRVFGPPC